MASFLAPSTPPMKCKISTDNANMDDINMLLYLDSIKRFKENESNINLQVKEAFCNYQEQRLKYLDLYAKYVNLVETSYTRCILIKQSNLTRETELESQIQEALNHDLKHIEEKITVGGSSCSDYIKDIDLQTFKDNLNCEDSKRDSVLSNMRSEVEDLMASTKSIQTLSKGIENALENCTLQGIGDVFVAEINMKNFPNTCHLYE